MGCPRAKPGPSKTQRRGVALGLFVQTEDPVERRRWYSMFLDEIKDVGATDVSWVVRWSQADVQASEVAPKQGVTVADEVVLEVAPADIRSSRSSRPLRFFRFFRSFRSPVDRIPAYSIRNQDSVRGFMRLHRSLRVRSGRWLDHDHRARSSGAGRGSPSAGRTRRSALSTSDGFWRSSHGAVVLLSGQALSADRPARGPRGACTGPSLCARPRRGRTMPVWEPCPLEAAPGAARPPSWTPPPDDPPWTGKATAPAWFAPADARRRARRSCWGVEVHVRVGLPEALAPPDPCARSTTTARNRRSWKERTNAYALPPRTGVQIRCHGLGDDGAGLAGLAGNGPAQACAIS